MDLASHAHAIANAYQPPDTGRPSLLGDAEALQELFRAIEDGNYLETACHLAGLAPVTVHNWRKRGEAGEEPHAAFVKALKRAESRAEALAVANVRAAGRKPQFWAAEMTFLERRHPERWGRRTDENSAPRVVVQIGVKDSDVAITLSPPSPQQLDPISTVQVTQQSLINGDSVNSAIVQTSAKELGPAKSMQRQKKAYNRRHPPRRRARRANPAGGPTGASGLSSREKFSGVKGEFGMEGKGENRENVPGNGTSSPSGETE